MSEYFTFNTTPTSSVPEPQAPIFPDFNHESDMSKRMFMAKQVNDNNYWKVMCEVINHDFNTLPKHRFKAWASVMMVPFMTRAKLTENIRVVLNAMNEDPFYAEVVKENFVGLTANDFNNIYAAFEDFPTTMNRIQHLAHLIICGYTPEVLSKMDTIVELGGGIGEMTDIIYKLGFKGKYILYDFPEVGQLQAWYHKQLGYDNVVHTSDLNDLVNADLCIATWSLTEMPLDLRDEVMAKIGDTKNWLVAYSNQIFGFDNAKYIAEDFIPRFTNHDVETIPLPYMPWDGGTNYLTVKTR
jgi:hypothetical protein